MPSCRALGPDSEYITDWVSHGSGPGVTVYGFPSKGGIYVLHDCLGVELDFLRHDRFQDTPRPSKSDPDYKAKEDAHCDDMRRLGATWWRRLFLAYEKEMTGESETEEFTRVGWPASGGVWVLHSTVAEARNMGSGIIHNANSMEERCKVIEQLGGIFYADPKDCPYLDLP
ncbi:hypothetical protein PEX1_058290 [Penicillium expansum]|uniref:Uncharacterized protein n=1 Tax=Penicillium expansum TaxID=27334 RepID=A0A0A2ISC3_PENEN|nr:hypothetical protein PEX2_041690 [Penicillium expansum]KGO45363.1 hypothetical protein PEXP_059770 [Penicillium expansum]KGO63155.1 hypothetical protein PEX2_041690 [Penicillium expansum]KGO72607.1 hypothetical protein PEX1_058290 [Penicillium expansum]